MLPRLVLAGIRRPTRECGCRCGWKMWTRCIGSVWRLGWRLCFLRRICRGTCGRCICGIQMGSVSGELRGGVGIRVAQRAGGNARLHRAYSCLWGVGSHPFAKSAKRGAPVFLGDPENRSSVPVGRNDKSEELSALPCYGQVVTWLPAKVLAITESLAAATVQMPQLVNLMVFLVTKLAVGVVSLI